MGSGRFRPHSPRFLLAAGVVMIWCVGKSCVDVMEEEPVASLGGGGIGAGIANIREVRSSAPPGDKPLAAAIVIQLLAEGVRLFDCWSLLSGKKIPELGRPKARAKPSSSHSVQP